MFCDVACVLLHADLLCQLRNIVWFSLSCSTTRIFNYDTLFFSHLLFIWLLCMFFFFACLSAAYVSPHQLQRSMNSLCKWCRYIGWVLGASPNVRNSQRPAFKSVSRFHREYLQRSIAPSWCVCNPWSWC